MAKEKYKSKLLVEGKDDQHVIWALCQKFGIAENFDVVDCDGIDNLIQAIPIRLKQADIAAIGIIVDADVELSGRWESIKTILTKAGFNCPVALPEKGLLINNGQIRIGLWIMPNNSTDGMIEDFISFLVPEDDQLLKVAAETLHKIEDSQLNKYNTRHKSKALIHSWLSWQDTPGTPMGLAITKNYLAVDRNECSNLIDWITLLFT